MEEEATWLERPRAGGVIILEGRLFLVLLPSLLRSRGRVHVGGGHLGGDYVTGAALRPVEVKGTNIRISVSAEGCPHSPKRPMSGHPCPQRVVHIALSD